MLELTRYFARYLADLLAELGSKDFEEKFGVDRSTIGNWERKSRTSETFTANTRVCLGLLRSLPKHGHELWDTWVTPEARVFLEQNGFEFLTSGEEHQSMNPNRKSLRQVAEWERDFPNLKQFWVVLSRSLVFTDEHFVDVMVQNLKRGVVYLYFIAEENQDDLRKLQIVVRRLREAAELQGCAAEAQIDQRIRFIALQPAQIGRLFTIATALIANPGSMPQGMQIIYALDDPIGGCDLPLEPVDNVIAFMRDSQLWDEHMQFPGVSVSTGRPGDREDILDRVREAVTNNEPLTIRSPSYNGRSFSFSTPGNCHLHVDVAGQPEALASIANEIMKLNGQWKISTIIDVAVGPQKFESKFKATYESHNLPHDEFDYFLTADLSDGVLLNPGTPAERGQVRRRVIEELRRLLPKVRERLGIIVEVERVVGRLFGDSETEWVTNVNDFARVSTDEIEFAPSRTMDFEIHHGFDIPKSTSVPPPLRLEELVAECKDREIVLGGWFLFANSTHWMYRSNCFTTAKDYKPQATRQHKAIGDLLRSNRKRIGMQWQQKSVCEQILGIWNMNDIRRGDKLGRAAHGSSATASTQCQRL